jgi:hypothetical protein
VALGHECEGGFNNLHFFTSISWTLNHITMGKWRGKENPTWQGGRSKWNPTCIIIPDDKEIDRTLLIVWPNQGALYDTQINRISSHFCQIGHINSCSAILKSHVLHVIFLQNLHTMIILDPIFYRTLFYDFRPVISPRAKPKVQSQRSMPFYSLLKITPQI